MLIRFRVSNFLSFYDEVELSMIPGLNKQHTNHVIQGNKKTDVRLLKSAIIYGPNASGKSNLIKAVEFARRLIISGTQIDKHIPVKKFKLLKQASKESSKFEFEIRCGEKDYIYGFEINSGFILAEWLYKIRPTTVEMLFERSSNLNEETTQVRFSKKIEKLEKYEFLKFTGQGTNIKQLFLTESKVRNVHIFDEIYNWFRNTIKVIFPETRFNLEMAMIANEDIVSHIVENLGKYDTGVCGFDFEKVNIKDIPLFIIEDIERELDPKKVAFVQSSEKGINNFIVLQKNEDGSIMSHKIVFTHVMDDCNEEVNFEINEESDGTIRLIDLLPMINQKVKQPSVYFIDELNRSLHPNLTRQLVHDFLSKTQKNFQLISTTHEAGLLTTDLLRRDEIWFIQKEKNGSSSLYSLEEFKTRHDLDLEKGYLMGRFGAVPILTEN